MKKKMTIISISLLTAFVIMSSGYGTWQKELTIEGKIVIEPTDEDSKKLVEDEVNRQKEELLKMVNGLEEKELLGKQIDSEFKETDITIEDKNVPKDEDIQEDIREEKETTDEGLTDEIIYEEDNANDPSEDITNSQENNTEELKTIPNLDIDDLTTQLEIDSSDN